MTPNGTRMTRASAVALLTVLVIAAMSTTTISVAIAQAPLSARSDLSKDSNPAFAIEPDPDRLKSHVTVLASKEFEGRQGEGARKAADYVERHFREFQLKPLFGDQFSEPIVSQTLNKEIGRNVGAKIEAADPNLSQEWIVVSAHFDHVGIRGGKLYPGADDNASGVAMMLEVARILGEHPEQCRRGVIFIGFDLEEPGLWGSRDFVDHPPIPLERIRLFITADMLSRSLGGVCRSHLFVTGTERIPETRPWLEDAAKGKSLKLGMIGTDIVGTRSDYGPFRSNKVPFLFFSTGENPCYHTPEDVAETVDYPKLHEASGLILNLVRRAAREPELPKWRAAPDNPLSEALTIREVLKILYENREELRLNGLQQSLISNQVDRLDKIAERGSITPSERAAMVRVAQLVMATAL